jgi:hypothetical protein
MIFNFDLSSIEDISSLENFHNIATSENDPLITATDSKNIFAKNPYAYDGEWERGNFNSMPEDGALFFLRCILGTTASSLVWNHWMDLEVKDDKFYNLFRNKLIQIGFGTMMLGGLPLAILLHITDQNSLKYGDHLWGNFLRSIDISSK